MKTLSTRDTKKNELLKSNEKNFFHTIFGFPKSDYTKGKFAREKPIEITGNDNTLLKHDFLKEVL